MRVRALVLLALVMALGGCGYTLRGTLPAHIQTISVPIFLNRTQEPGVESIITRAVVESFSTNGRLKVASRDKADAVLDGEVTGYTVLSIAFDKDANVRLYRLSVSVNLRLRDLRENKVLFQQDNVREQADFRVQDVVSQTISREDTAVRVAAAEIGRAIVSLTISRF